MDEALVGWGFPVGPFQLMDEVGLDVAAKAGAVVADAFGARFAPAPALRRVLTSGRPGRKGGQGFYKYDGDGKRQGVDASVYAVAQVTPARPGAAAVAAGGAAAVTADDVVRRCVYPMLDEAVRCLDDGVLAQPRDGDVGAVFGIGYPPFRGGPFRTLDALGAAEVAGALDQLARRFPGRFAPSARLLAMARASACFYPPALA